MAGGTPGGGGDAVETAGGAAAERRTVGRCLDRAAAYLTARGVATGRLEARVLMGHCTGLPVERIVADPERPLSALQAAAFRRLVVRRGARREPLQYLTGEAEFYARPFYVNRRVLIPRPETELLVEETVRRLAGSGGALPPHATGAVGPPMMLADLGTGSGILAVTLALELPTAVVHAVDISRDALAVAAENARRHGVVERIRFYEGDLWMPLAAAGLDGALAGVVANPPYVAEEEWAGLPPEVRLHEPREALVAAAGGLAFYHRIVAGLRFLRPGGWLLVEVGAAQGSAVAGLFAAAGLVDVGVRRDYAGHERIVSGSTLGRTGMG